MLPVGHSRNCKLRGQSALVSSRRSDLAPHCTRPSARRTLAGAAIITALRSQDHNEREERTKTSDGVASRTEISRPEVVFS
jgi:hypothetical protein